MSPTLSSRTRSVAILAAWTVLFDVQWLLTGRPRDIVTHAELLYLIGIHCSCMGVEDRGGIYLVQALAYALNYFVVAIFPLY